MDTAQRLPSPYRPEADVVADRLRTLDAGLDWPGAAAMVRPWVEGVRRHPPPFWAMESLLKEYPIDSHEGLALMRLAEALLRVPDADTAIALTADQLGRADFGASSDSALARLSQAAIGLSRRMLPHGEAQPGLLARLGARTVVAAALRAVQLLGRQFVLAQDIGDALDQADATRRGQGLTRFSFDMLGEGARTEADALRYLESYRHAIESIALRRRGGGPVEHSDGISIKLSALHPRYDALQRNRVLAELVPRVWGLCHLAARADIGLTIDAEEADRLELSLDVFDAVAAQVAQQHPQWQGLGLALQSYQTRALELVRHVVALARQHRLRLMCRLVKGAYWDSEIKRAQELGLPHYPVFTHKHHTDVSYLACARELLQAPDAVFAQFATHNAGTIAAILQMAASSGAPFELQRLHGMGEGVYREVSRYTPSPSGQRALPPTPPPPRGGDAIPVRVYAPVGEHRDLLAYLVRRLLENGANTSFVHQLADESLGLDRLLASPLRLAPTASLPLPVDLYRPERANSRGLDLTVEAMRAPLLAAYESVAVPQVEAADPDQVPGAVRRSVQAWEGWRAVPVAQRARVLRRAADAMEAAMPALCALLVKEARKTWGDCVAEVREAVDFLRYYAGEVERLMQPAVLPGPTGESNELRLAPRGPWVCISPWNFPLAIFTGQVAAALATGNTVLAKPAEQTPGIAAEAVKLLLSAGVPPGALQLLHGPGETVGAALVVHPDIAGVVFTGSTQVAKHIQRSLAAKEGALVPLIAETGGINAMVVDSTALPEQVADAVMQSAFRSAGQRCSALRLLCLHESIAEPVLAMVTGAARELVTGDPARLSTDVGPVIDREAFEGLRKHLQRLHATARSRLGLNESAPDARDCLMAPHIFEVGRIADVRQEVFGPVLQVVRWSGDPLGVIDEINALGYGLTLGIQTRIDSRAQALAARARVGNVYVNRNMVGAVVGVQPFGGEGRSGTGPKAGGPHYLPRFCVEQTLTINTTAAGGNVALLT